MKTYLYLSTAIISVSLATSENAWAQCVSTQDCATLGYTESSCPNGGIKCPFGSKWFCGGDNTAICKQEGFTNACTGTGQLGKGENCANLYKQCDCQSTYKYTCSGAGYAGGSGSACNGKYTACKCSSDYNWNATEGICKPKEDFSACKIGTFFYSDNTCSDEYISSKILLGVVIYEKTSSENGWVMAHKPIEISLASAWGGYGTDIPELTNYTSTPTDIQESCNNTDIITAYGDSSTYPAAWAAKNNYSDGNKKWCLPSGGLLNVALNNSTNFTKFQDAIYKIQTAAGSEEVIIPGEVNNGYETILSSSEYSSTHVWAFTIHINYLGASYRMSHDHKSNYSANYIMIMEYSLRPVFAF